MIDLVVLYSDSEVSYYPLGCQWEITA
jgi:hypothetical protein